MNEIVIELEPDAVPIVRIIAAQFRRSLHNPTFANTARTMSGVFALASSKDPQSVTVTVSKGKISLRHGIGPEARIVITTDLDDPSATPKIKGLMRHPLLAIRAGKLLEDYPLPWQEVARHFWKACQAYPGMPASIHMHCTDDDSDILLGEVPATTHFYGTGKMLGSVFGGGNILVQAMMEGKLQGECALPELAKLSEVTKDLLLGRIREDNDRDG